MFKGLTDCSSLSLRVEQGDMSSYAVLVTCLGPELTLVISGLRHFSHSTMKHANKMEPATAHSASFCKRFGAGDNVGFDVLLVLAVVVWDEVLVWVGVVVWDGVWKAVLVVMVEVIFSVVELVAVVVGRELLEVVGVEERKLQKRQSRS